MPSCNALNWNKSFASMIFPVCPKCCICSLPWLFLAHLLTAVCMVYRHWNYNQYCNPNDPFSPIVYPVFSVSSYPASDFHPAGIEYVQNQGAPCLMHIYVNYIQSQIWLLSDFSYSSSCSWEIWKSAWHFHGPSLFQSHKLSTIHSSSEDAVCEVMMLRKLLCTLT